MLSKDSFWASSSQEAAGGKIYFIILDLAKASLK